MKYDMVDITSDEPWDPSKLHDGDTSAVTDEEYVAACNSLVCREGNLMNMFRSAYGLESRYKPEDIEQVRPCLGWKPLHVIKKTLESITQYAKTQSDCH